MKVFLFDRQAKYRIDLTLLRRQASAVLPTCLGSPGPGAASLPDLEELEITFVDDDEIARIHLDFMDIPGATDVITFDHGEIVISAETAARYGVEFGNGLERELTLYMIHGLLHLNGHEDATTGGFNEMKEIQERILEEHFPI